MANHASADKRARQNAKRRLHNRYYVKTTRNAIKALRNTTDKSAAVALLPKIYAEYHSQEQGSKPQERNGCLCKQTGIRVQVIHER